MTLIRFQYLERRHLPTNNKLPCAVKLISIEGRQQKGQISDLVWFLLDKRKLISYRVSQKKLSLVENSRGKYNSCGWEIQ